MTWTRLTALGAVVAVAGACAGSGNATVIGTNGSGGAHVHGYGRDAGAAFVFATDAEGFAVHDKERRASRATRQSGELEPAVYRFKGDSAAGLDQPVDELHLDTRGWHGKLFNGKNESADYLFERWVQIFYRTPVERIVPDHRW